MSRIDTIRAPRSLVAAVAAAALSASPLLGQAAGEGGVSLPLGSVPEAVTIEDLDGNPVDLGALVEGKPAVIEFWATWCELCEALQPEMDRVHSLYGDRVQVVAVAVGVAQTVRRIKEHLAAHDPGYPFLWDGRGAAVRAFDAVTTSIVVMLDADGKVAYTGSGGNQQLVAAVENILGR